MGVKRIDLHLPMSWDQCTTNELEHIADAIITEQASTGRFRPFNWERVKLNIVLAINGLTPDPSPVGDGSGDQEFMVHRGDEEPWPISTGQLCSLCEKINWLTEKTASRIIFRFPYPEILIRHTSGTIQLQGPPPLLDGYTWKEYRWLTDWMQEYMRRANDRTRNEFLSILFKPAASDIDHHSSAIFEGFSPIKWQVILFWWSSLMEQLAKKFPRVFKQQPVGKGKRLHRPDAPWDFYNRVTATVQKYVGGLSAQDVDEQPYGVTLQQLEMMADEAAEMEKIKRKK